LGVLADCLPAQRLPGERTQHLAWPASLAH
jgi:hypothetical protein